jgi:DNA modification methylase
LGKAIGGSVQVSGSDSQEHKENSLLGFSGGDIQKLITKPRIAGFGMNWQHCSNMIFVGLSDSYEQFYQATRRCWRFGQKEVVHVYIIICDTEGAVLANIRRKEADAMRMANKMVENMKEINKADLKKTTRTVSKYTEGSESGDNWELRLGDCVDGVARIETDSIDYSVYSPPFASLYTYSASDRDMGNCSSIDEFREHYAYLMKDMLRVTAPGRLMSFHCMNLPTTKTHDGYIGIKDFRGELIRMCIDLGWIYHSEVVIWKNPVVAMQRTKAIGLLHKQMTKDSCMSRQGIPDYVVTMRKPGENKKPVQGELTEFIGDKSTFQNTGRLSIDIWQKYASPIWDDINATRTLQAAPGREHKDERHICPLQLDVIERCLQLWSNPGDLVLSPFAGIGSEGYCSIKYGRRFLGIELKESYWKTSIRNLKQAEYELSEQIIV